MKRIAKTSLIVLLAALFSTQIFAQKRGNDDRRGDRNRPDRDRIQLLMNIPAEVRSDIHVSVFDEYLSLTDAQKKELIAVDQTFNTKMSEVRDEKVNRRKKGGMMKDLRDEHQQAIHKVLTKDQYSVYLEKREAIRYDIRQRLMAYSKEEG